MWFHRNEIEKEFRRLRENRSDIFFRTLTCCGESVSMAYIKQLTDRAALSETVIKPLLQHCAGAKKAPDAQEVLETILYVDDCTLQEDPAEIEAFILNGMTVMVFSNDHRYIVANVKEVAHRAIPEPTFQYTLSGPKDCFIEDLDSNLSLMRYRLKDSALKVEFLEVGRRTHTRIAMVYIEGIANDICIQEVRKRLEAIDVDGFLGSGELQSYLLNRKWSLFPNTIITERSDMASEQTLEGKVLLFVEGSQHAVAAPIAFVEFMYACDDRYGNALFGAFMRLLRFMAFFLSFSASSYWVAIVSFHTDILPATFIISLASQMSRVPFNALTSALVLEIILELIRETLLRVPEKIGSAIAIVSTLIIGQASITAGVFSPLLLIIISIEFLASFATPNFMSINPFRIMKFALLLMTGMLGFYGFILGITIIVAEMVSINSFGVPYLAPYAPFNLYDFLRTFIYNKRFSPERQNYMKTKDENRAKKP